MKDRFLVKPSWARIRRKIYGGPEKDERGEPLLDPLYFANRDLARSEFLETFFPRLAGSEEEPTLVFTGHQPGFPHPGIMTKNALAHFLARRQPAGLAVNLVVDTDHRALELPLPVYTRRFFGDFLLENHLPSGLAARIRRVLEKAFSEEELNNLYSDEINWFGRRTLPLSPPRVLARAQITADQLKAIRDRMNTASGQLPANWTDLRRRLAWLADMLSPDHFPGNGTNIPLVNLLNRIRRATEEQAGLDITDIPLSQICHLASYRGFLNEIAGRAGEYRAAFNQSLKNYRSEHNIHNNAQPLPDLGPGELPFWKLVCTSSGRSILLPKDTKDSIPTDDRQTATPGHCPAHPTGDCPDWRRLPLLVSDLAEEENLLAWPRANSLTIFARLFLCDVFIHGTGGARYDTISDDVIRTFFGIEPPEFITATTTLAPPFPDTPRDYPRVILNQLDLNCHRLRKLQGHPENITHSDPREFRRKIIHGQTRPESLLFRRAREILRDRPEYRRERDQLAAKLREDCARFCDLKNRRDRTWPWIYFDPETLVRYFQ